MRSAPLACLISITSLGLLGFASSQNCQGAQIRELLELRENLLSETNGEKFLKQPRQLRAGLQSKKTEAGTSNWPWRREIVTTVFWIGEKPARNNPVPNNKSSWDQTWEKNYGGYDCPKNRIGFRPAGFIPKQNPFYIALPYNDIGPKGTKPEAKKVIPWFESAFEENGKSVVKGRWIAIRAGNKTAYAQWEDTGPYRTDHWQYVFGNDSPSPNRNGGAGLDISPAVRDYLGVTGKTKTDWKFVETWEVPSGPWTKYGENNPFSPQFSKKSEREKETRQELVSRKNYQEN